MLENNLQLQTEILRGFKSSRKKVLRRNCNF